MLNFISLKSLNEDFDEPRISSLAITDKHSGLEVVGVLPHNYVFEPASIEDADKMIEWLQNWKKNH